MTLRNRAKGNYPVLLGAVAAVSMALPGALAIASTVTVPETTVRTDGTKLIRVDSVPFGTLVIEDDSLPVDVEVEKQPGANGVKHVYATAVYQESTIPVIREEVVEPAQDRIIHRGTLVQMPKAEAPPEPEPVVEPVPVASRSNPTSAPSQSVSVPDSTAATSGQYSLGDLMFMGVVNWSGYKFTYYSQSVLPGGGLAIPGRHVSSAGFVSDESGYIVLAAAPGIPRGSVFSTPFGASGKVYDTCASCTPNWLDVYTR